MSRRGDEKRASSVISGRQKPFMQNAHGCTHGSFPTQDDVGLLLRECLALTMFAGRVFAYFLNAHGLFHQKSPRYIRHFLTPTSSSQPPPPPPSHPKKTPLSACYHSKKFVFMHPERICLCKFAGGELRFIC